MKERSARRIADALYKRCGIIGLRKTVEILEIMCKAAKKAPRFRKDTKKIATMLEQYRLKIVAKAGRE